jgi:hypothetical protein
MEEGPEPHETIERTVEHHEHAQHETGGHGATMVPAVTAAVLAVLAAAGSLLSGHAANEAILAQSRANDAWSYYQAKSTKRHIYRADRKVLEALRKGLPGVSQSELTAADDTLRKSQEKEEGQLDELRKSAAEEQRASKHEFLMHQNYAKGIAAFQVGIVLASISILVRQRVLYALSVVAGLVGIGFVLYGLLFTPEPPLTTGGEAHRIVTDQLL